MTFLERFKGKTSTINRNGDIGEGVIRPAPSIKPPQLAGVSSKYSLEPTPCLFKPRNEVLQNKSSISKVSSSPCLAEQVASVSEIPPSGKKENGKFLKKVSEISPKPQYSEAASTIVYQGKKYPYSVPQEAISEKKLPPEGSPNNIKDQLYKFPIEYKKKTSIMQAAYEQLAPSKPFIESNKKGNNLVHPPLCPQPLQTVAEEINNSASLLNKYRKTPVPTKQLPTMSRSASISEINGRGSEYKMYSITDYKKITPQQYITFGGLGANIGTREWELRKDKVSKMTEYARNVNMNNKTNFFNHTSQLILSTPHFQQDPAINRAKKMREYAQKIPKPKQCRFESESTLPQSTLTEPLSELEKLEKEHCELRAQVIRLKKETN